MTSSVQFNHMKHKHNGWSESKHNSTRTVCQEKATLNPIVEAVCIKEILTMLNSTEEWGNSNITRKRISSS